MNWVGVARTLAHISLMLSPLGLVPLPIDWHDGRDIQPWLEMIGGFLLAALVLRRIGRGANPVIGPAEGAAITTCAWVLIAVLAGWGLQRSHPGADRRTAASQQARCQ